MGNAHRGVRGDGKAGGITGPEMPGGKSTRERRDVADDRASTCQQQRVRQLMTSMFLVPEEGCQYSEFLN
ncbi:hypothetical protein GCM10010285_28150 [Streptomyces pseudogriseolus]|uniref:Transposase n=1 Tax=Streptomyces pseudogriseolus TaxID=36817 RepID=A0ABQ2T4I7_STREZ|nr:hypothetical protein GCM10010285_28150 [Streptomyces rubiginosus]